MFRSTASPLRFARRAASLAILAAAGTVLGGCTAIVVTGAVVGVAASGVGLAVDAGVGAVKLTGKAVGAAAGAVMPGGDE